MKTKNIKPIEVPITPEEEAYIQAEFQGLLDDYAHTRKGDKADLITRAFEFAKKAHGDKRRLSGQPYICHPLAVARIVSGNIGMGSTSISAALLHDVVKDTDTTFEEIDDTFGERIGNLVRGLTRISGGNVRFVTEETSDDSHKGIKNPEEQAENFRNLLLTMCEDVRVILVKIADRLHNMRTLASQPANKQYKIAGETLYIYAPLANRLGLNSIKTELEELVMRYTYPQKYAEIEALIGQTSETEAKLMECFVAPIRQLLDQNGYSYHLKTRVKSVYSCWKKMQNKGVDFDEIYDLYAMRIILDTQNRQECFKVYSLITSLFRPNPARTRDWITAPKTNGYESLHTTVMSPLGRWVEVQIRTNLMDQVAEKGMAAHFLYKEAHPDAPAPENNAVEDWLASIRTTLESTERSALDLVEEFKETLYTKVIYLFTPKGETVTLPSRSTVLDFAYAIHSQLGTNCIGAKVNSKVVPINYILHSGEQVQILTSRKTEPEESWLKIVRTPRAKEHIKDYLRKQRKDSRDQGEQLLKDIFERLDLKFSDENLARIRRFFNIDNDIDLYYRIAIGTLTENQIAQCFGRQPRTPNILFNETSNPFLLDSEYEQFESLPAPCCKPIPGDDVIGINENGKIYIHRSNCRHAMHEMSTHEDRIVRAKWRPGEKVKLLAGISITAIDRKGILQEICQIISSDMNLNMRAITLEASEGIGKGRVMLYVDNLHVLQSLIENLQKIEGVERVSRL